MCDFLASDGLQARLVPGPSLERGHALAIKAHPKEPKLIYCFGKYVIVRSLNDAGDNFVYRGHKHTVGAAAFAPNGFWVASGDANGFLRVWAWDNPEHILKVEVQVFAGAIKDVQWDGESKRIVVVGAGSNIKTKCVMWDTGNAVGEMVGHQKTVLSVAYRQQRPFRIFTGGEDFKCVFYKGPPFKLDHSCTEHSNYVNQVTYSRDGSHIASVGSDKKIVLYEGKEGTVEETFPVKHQGSVYCVAFSEDGTKLITGGADKALKVWKVGSGVLSLLAEPRHRRATRTRRQAAATPSTRRPIARVCRWHRASLRRRRARRRHDHAVDVVPRAGRPRRGRARKFDRDG